MPIRNEPGMRICASSRVRPKIPVLNDDGVEGAGADVCGAETGHMPSTGCTLLSVGLPFSSSEVMAIDRVQLALAGRENHGRSPKPLTEPTQSPPAGIAAGLVQVSDAAHWGTGWALPDIRMSCSRLAPGTSVRIIG